MYELVDVNQIPEKTFTVIQVSQTLIISIEEHLAWDNCKWSPNFAS